MLPVQDDEQQKRFDYAQHIANICVSEGFISLKKELERLYGCSGDEDNSPLLAFQDALFALILEEDPEFKRPLTAFGKG